jgi:hypothetical protein
MATGALTEQVIEEVAENLEEAAAVTRMIDAKAVSYFFGGSVFGIALGFYFGYRYNREKIRAEVFKESEAELDKIRDVYQRKTVAGQPKPTVEEVIEEKGYVVVDEVDIPARPLKPPVPIQDRPLFAKRTADGEKSKDDGWDYPSELARRGLDRPYIIHQDEFHLNESGFSQVTYTVYSDDVITEEDDTVINNADNLIGLDNLQHWGHGADDFNVLYIRNPVLDIEFEMCRTPKTYEETVLGLEHADESTYERMRRRRDAETD